MACRNAAVDCADGCRNPKRELRVLANYLPNLLFLIVATGIGISLMVIGRFIGPRRPDAEKLSPYECGSRHSRTRA